MTRTRTRAAALLAASALVVTAASGCASFSTSAKNTSAGNQSATGQRPALSLVAKNVGTVGNVVTDRDGMTLYRFDKDTANPPTSNCEGQCATAWPPLTTTETQIHLQGVDQSLVGTIARKDGSIQLTLGGWPLYRFAKDTAPGDTNGQGVSNTWYAATPQGKKAAGTAGAPANNNGGGTPANNGGSAPAGNGNNNGGGTPADSGGSGY
jgi:predicted lipoprotein with Yx(FWY)xxD motif